MEEFRGALLEHADELEVELVVGEPWSSGDLDGGRDPRKHEDLPSRSLQHSGIKGQRPESTFAEGTPHLDRLDALDRLPPLESLETFRDRATRKPGPSCYNLRPDTFAESSGSQHSQWRAGAIVGRTLVPRVLDLVVDHFLLAIHRTSSGESRKHQFPSSPGCLPPQRSSC